MAAAAAKAGAGLLVGGGLLAVGAKFALDAVEFKRNSLASLESIEGSKEAAAKTYAMLGKMTSQTGFNKGAVLESYQELRKAGMTVADTQVMLAGVMDVASKNMPNASQSIKAVTSALVGMSREGKLTTGMLDSIAEAGGPSLMQVASHIKGLQGLTEKQARARIDGGGISGHTGQIDVLKAINDVMNHGAGLGTSAKNSANSPLG